MDHLKDTPVFMDTRKAVAVYRDVLRQRDRAHNVEMQILFDGIASRLRDLWRDSIGVDNLDAIARGDILMPT